MSPPPPKRHGRFRISPSPQSASQQEIELLVGQHRAELVDFAAGNGFMASFPSAGDRAQVRVHGRFRLEAVAESNAVQAGVVVAVFMSEEQPLPLARKQVGLMVVVNR